MSTYEILSLAKNMENNKFLLNIIRNSIKNKKTKDPKDEYARNKNI